MWETPTSYVGVAPQDLAALRAPADRRGIDVVVKD